MDETDVVLSFILLQNSRTPYRTLADKLNLSVNAVHKRIQAMIEAGIIRGFTARPHLKVTGTLLVYIYGLARAEPIRDIPAKLSQSDSIFWVAQAGGGYIYVGLYVRSLGDLSSLSEFVRKTTDMPEPKVGIIYGEPSIPDKEGIDTLDWQIIHQLGENSRKPVADIASELRVSARTVRRRLDRMVSSSLIDLSIKWYPDASNDIISVFHTKLASGKTVNLPSLYNILTPNLLFPIIFINIPEENLLFTWTRTMKELKELRGKIEADPDFSSVLMNILYTGEIFSTWRDTISRSMGWSNQPP